MNIQGNVVEQRRNKVLMPFWHGLFSVGGVAGAMAGALAASLGLPLSWQLSTVSLLLLAAMWLATAFYVPDAKLHPAATEAQQKEPIFDEPQLLACERRADR